MMKNAAMNIRVQAHTFEEMQKWHDITLKSAEECCMTPSCGASVLVMSGRL